MKKISEMGLDPKKSAELRARAIETARKARAELNAMKAQTKAKTAERTKRKQSA